eukprot:gene17550-biopygen10688
MRMARGAPRSARRRGPFPVVGSARPGPRRASDVVGAGLPWAPNGEDPGRGGVGATTDAQTDSPSTCPHESSEGLHDDRVGLLRGPDNGSRRTLRRGMFQFQLQQRLP